MDVNRASIRSNSCLDFFFAPDDVDAVKSPYPEGAALPQGQHPPVGALSDPETMAEGRTQFNSLHPN